MKSTPFVVTVLSAASLVVFASTARAEVPSAVKRIDYALNALQATYGGKPINDMTLDIGEGQAKGVTDGEGVRSLLFRIESLVDLYGKDYPQLKSAPLGLGTPRQATVQLAIKNLEDHIGHYNDAKNFYNQAVRGGVATPAYLQEKLAHLTAEKADYAADLQAWTNGTAVQRIKTILHSVFPPIANAAAEKKDREILLKRMLEYITKLDTTVYDLTKLETGIHRLRRDIRNMDYYPFAMSGVIVWDSSACPVPAWNGYAPKAVTPVAPIADACQVSACLGGWVSNIQNNLAGIKQTAAEQGAANGKDFEFATPATIAAATKEYQSLKGGPKPLDQIRNQLQKCL